SSCCRLSHYSKPNTPSRSSTEPGNPWSATPSPFPNLPNSFLPARSLCPPPPDPSPPNSSPASPSQSYPTSHHREKENRQSGDLAFPGRAGGRILPHIFTN